MNHKIGDIGLSLGGAMNRYSGQHYGNVIWAEHASNADFNHLYYWNKAEKLDRNFYTKINYNYTDATNILIDLQSRRITYSFMGFDEYLNNTRQDIALEFFNPKIGVFHELNNRQSIYASFAVGNKEPNRNDYGESTPLSRPSHETLYDTEIGYKQTGKKLNLGVNIYHMDYKNQLVLTGQINDVGAYTRENVDNSFRQGIEIEAMYKLTSKIYWISNMTLSENKINTFSEYIDNWDTGEQENVIHENTDLAFSPNIIWSSQFNYQLNHKTSIDFISKYVGEQFIDNTSSEERKLDDYLVNHLHISYEWENKIFKTSKISLRINNLLNNEYVSNAWVYRFISEGWDPRGDDPYTTKSNEKGYNMAGYFPEATRNFLLGISLGL